MKPFAWIFAGILFSCHGEDGHTLPTFGEATARLGGSELKLKLFFDGPDRLRAGDAFPSLGPDEGALVGYDSDRHIHLYTTRQQTDFDCVFLSSTGDVLETAQLKRDDFVENVDRVEPAWVLRRGVTSLKPARYALLLGKDWLNHHPLEPGTKLEGSAEVFAQTPRPLPVVRIGAHRIAVELAPTEHERQRGLMHRRFLSPEEGMLFIYPSEEHHGFWMRNTLIPLDIAYVRGNGEIINVAEARVWKDPVRGLETVDPSAAPCKYVLEVNYGWFRRKGLLDASGAVVPGTKLMLPEEWGR